MFLFNISRVTHLNVAPVSTLIKLNFSATTFAIVPLPTPAGPSIATTNDIFNPPFFLAFVYLLLLHLFYPHS